MSFDKIANDRERIARVLKRKGFIEAYYMTYSMGITRGAARIFDLRVRGWKILTKKRPERLCMYVLVKAGKTA